MTTSYLVPARTAEAEVEVKRSRFLARVVRVEEEHEARVVVDEARRTHWDARHHCSAFVLGPTGAIERSSDDGEPAGTAGAPMLEVLRGAEVSDVVVVVTRWFGGTLLGAGGLVRAYGDAVRAGLEAAGTHRRELLHEFSVVLSHAEAGRVESELRTRGVHVLDTAYADQVTLRLGVTDPEPLAAWLAELTGGRTTPTAVGTSWHDVG